MRKPPPLAGATEADFDFVQEQHDAVSTTDRFDARQKPARWDDVATIGLHRFDNDAADQVRWDDRLEQIAFEVLQQRRPYL